MEDKYVSRSQMECTGHENCIKELGSNSFNNDDQNINFL